MTKRYVNKEVKAKIASIFQENGFKYVKAQDNIIRKQDYGFDSIEFRIIDYNPIFQIEFSIAIRLDAIENIVNMFLGEDIINSQYKHLTATVASSYDIMTGSEENYIEVHNEDELEVAIQELAGLIKDKGLEFFKSYSQLSTANILKKTQILEDKSGLSYILRNLMQSLTLLKLCNDPDFDKLCDNYQKLYVPWVGQEESGRKAMDDLIEYLKKLD